jgi:CheY-like chemotaxis protein
VSAPSAPVMVVDDDTDVRESLVETLRDEGYAVISARNGRDALEQLRRSDLKPGVILLDLMMPVMDGQDFRAEQLKDPGLASIPVVVVTADARGLDKAGQMRAQATMQKPFDLPQLFSLVQRYCHGAPRR